jgi:hypothetical protein
MIASESACGFNFLTAAVIGIVGRGYGEIVGRKRNYTKHDPLRSSSPPFEEQFFGIDNSCGVDGCLPFLPGDGYGFRGFHAEPFESE